MELFVVARRRERFVAFVAERCGVPDDGGGAGSVIVMVRFRGAVVFAGRGAKSVTLGSGGGAGKVNVLLGGEGFMVGVVVGCL